MLLRYVSEGDVLVRLDPTRYENALHTAQIELAQAEAAYGQQLKEAALAVEAGEAQVESTQAQIPSLSVADINLQAAREAESRVAYEYQKAQDRDWEPPEVVEAYRLEWVAAQRAVAVAEAEYNSILNQQWAVSQQANALSKNVSQTNLNVQYLADTGVNTLLQLAVDEAAADLARTTITAPFDGVVLEALSAAGNGAPADSSLVQGQFLDGDTSGQLQGAYVLENGEQLCFSARPSVSALERAASCIRCALRAWAMRTASPLRP